MMKKKCNVKPHMRKTKKGKSFVKKHKRTTKAKKNRGAFQIPKIHMNKYVIEGEPLNPKADELYIGVGNKQFWDTKEEAEKAMKKIPKRTANQFKEIEVEKESFIEHKGKFYKGDK